MAHHILPEHINAVIQMCADQIVRKPLKMLGHNAVARHVVFFVRPHSQPVLMYFVRGPGRTIKGEALTRQCN